MGRKFHRGPEFRLANPMGRRRDRLGGDADSVGGRAVPASCVVQKRGVAPASHVVQDRADIRFRRFRRRRKSLVEYFAQAVADPSAPASRRSKRCIGYADIVPTALRGRQPREAVCPPCIMTYAYGCSRPGDGEKPGIQRESLDALASPDSTPLSAGKVPIPTLERLTTYLRCLIDAGAAGVETVSSAQLETQSGISAAQFRKDISYFGEFGKPGVGYGVRELEQRLARILQIHKYSRFC